MKNKMMEYLEEPDFSFLEECEGYISHMTDFAYKTSIPNQDA
jgi:hypothetical protein